MMAERAVKFLPNGRQLRAGRTGHQIDGPCTWDLNPQAFVKTPSAHQLNAGCVERAQRPPFAIEMPR